MSGNEILTIQFGTYANHVGAHYFNIQESGFSYNPNFVPEVDNDILFREAESNGRPAYTPRLLVVDANFSIGGDVSLTGETFSDLPPEEEVKKNVGDAVVDVLDKRQEARTTPLSTNPLASYEDISDKVKYWTDFISVPVNHRTYHIIDSLLLPENVLKDGLYSYGADIWSRSDFEESIVDDIRYHLEDCDNLQGFHVLIDSQTLFSGVSSGCLQHLRDEYGKKTILSCPLFNNIGDKDQSAYFSERLNAAHSFSKCTELCDLVVPLGTDFNPYQLSTRKFHLLNFKEDCFNTSSLQAVGLEMITLPYRIRDRSVKLDSLTKNLNIYGRSVLSTVIHVPWTLNRSGYLYDELMNWKGQFTPLTPILQCDNSFLDVQWITAKFNIPLLIRESDKKMLQDINPVLSFTKNKEIFEYYFYTLLNRTKTLATPINEKFRLPKNFPDIFKQVQNCSYKIPEKAPDGVYYGNLRSMEVIAGLQQTREIASLLKEINLNENFMKRAVPKLDKMGLKMMDLETDAEQLTNMVSCYEPTEFL
ncbi:protein misato [Cimex lectularius]|uniref:Protein misato n=1 Tax=Cimex lectularius TaxID=79782 RepID=A0A8I6RS94_CIMLE|nr:protein misato [Cimex lectularius]